MNKGKLYICGTPIGNLEDMTFRVMKILQTVDYIAAEDTRHTLKLLNHFEIQKGLVSYYQHNQRKQGEKLLADLMAGKNIALVTDAGMPGISDPGQEIIQSCIEADIPFELVPGPTAAMTALVGSGLDTSRFSFEGFLDRDRKKRKERLERIKEEDRTLIFYEAPHRLKETLKDAASVLGDRKAVVARELTKKFEEFKRGTLGELVDWFEQFPPRGELVLMVEGMSQKALEAIQEERFAAQSVEEHLRALMAGGLDKKEAIKQVAKERGLAKREVYQAAIDMTDKD